MKLSRNTIICAAALSAACASARAENCARLSGLKIADVTITAAEPMATGSTITSPAGEPLPAAKAGYCRVRATAKPTADSDIRFELWIPTAADWNGKFEQVGNGGFAGAIPYRFMSYVLSLGYAVAGTDDGHQAKDMIDASWALNHPEKVQDYGWRAVSETTVAAKQILRKAGAKAPARSYFVGCSDGGREALMLAQRFPTYFDGIIAGAPAYSMTRLLTNGVLLNGELGGASAYMAPPQLALLQRTALDSCANGAAYLKDPRGCRIDVAALTCGPGAAESCLTAAQAKTARIVYAERKDPDTGKPLYGVLPGAEAIKGSWDAWLTGMTADGRSAGTGFAWNYAAYMVMGDSKLDLGKVTSADLERGERTYRPVIDADNADLTAFKAHGGRLIQYHGWNDPAIPPGYSLEYRDRLIAKTPGTDEFYRLYMVPGMLHCSGGDAPTQVDWQAALEAWVEKSLAPGTLVASDGRTATQTLEPFGLRPHP